MTYKEKYQEFLEKTGQDLSYENWLELQLSSRVRYGSKSGKKIQQLSIDDETVFGEYASISEAARLTNINRVLISRHINRPEKYKSAGGFIWRVK